MRTRWDFRLLALVVAAIGCLLTAPAAGVGPQEEKSWPESDQPQSKGKADGSQSADIPKQAGGRFLVDSKGHGDARIFRGQLIRPLVPAGASGPTAPEEGSFTLRPGDVLEIECAIPKNIQGNLIFKVEDEKILKMTPMGVRQLIPVAMVGGAPKKVTGMVRGLAFFQAENEGETTVRLDLGLRQFEYKVKVRRGEED